MLTESNNANIKRHLGVGPKNGFTFVFNSNHLKRRHEEHYVAGHSKLLGNSDNLLRFPIAIHDPGTSALIRLNI